MISHDQIISLNKVHFPLTTLGFGRRVGIWTQGCSIRCPGCVNHDTWERRAEGDIRIDRLVKSLGEWLAEADGVTISGGEPFDQPEALLCLVRRLRSAVAGDLLVYSGYPLPTLVERFPNVLQAIDVLISEPYDAKSPQTKIWRGSDNQVVTLLSPLAWARYDGGINGMAWASPRNFDVMLSGEDIWLVGIPKRQTMQRLQAKLKQRGFAARTSQQPKALA